MKRQKAALIRVHSADSLSCMRAIASACCRHYSLRVRQCETARGAQTPGQAARRYLGAEPGDLPSLHVQLSQRRIPVPGMLVVHPHCTHEAQSACGGRQQTALSIDWLSEARSDQVQWPAGHGSVKMVISTLSVQTSASLPMLERAGHLLQHLKLEHRLIPQKGLCRTCSSFTQ